MLQADIELKAQAAPRLLCALRGLVRGYLSNAGIGTERTEELTLAIDEACANVVRHAYRGREPGELRMRLARGPEGLEIVIEDDGETAPQAAINAQLGADVTAESVRPGGLGVPLMRRVFDEVRFEPCGELGNRVVLRTHVDEGLAEEKGAGGL